MPDGIRVVIRGNRRIERALERLPADAQREVKDGSQRIARDLANKIRAVGRRDSRQSARAARTVRVARATSPKIVAGPHVMLFGSVFGSNRKTGWYAWPQYRFSTGRQYRPHLGGGSYWFFPTVTAEERRIKAEYNEMASEIVRRWRA